MRPTKEELSALIDRYAEFLIHAGWVKSHVDRGVSFYVAPASLNIQGAYSIVLPISADRPGAERLLGSAAKSISDIYGISNAEDIEIGSAAVYGGDFPVRLATRFLDKSTETNGIRLSSLASYAHNMLMSLYRSAKFKLGVESKDASVLARNFSEECLFLQTRSGSFVTTIEIPNSVLKQPDLFDKKPVASQEVCVSLFSSIQFLNEKILQSEMPIDSSEVIGAAIVLFDVELLESLIKVFVESNIGRMDFTLELGDQIRQTSTGWMSNEGVNRLKEFLNFVRTQLRTEANLAVSGAIVELRSRDPDGSRNYIRVVSDYYGDKVFVSATLSNEQYQQALDAHGHKRKVFIRGNGTRLKTQIRIDEVLEFKV
jgi:hypothetical protein